MPQLKLLKCGDISELTIQRTVMQWVRLQPKIQKLVLHFPNEGKRTVRYGKILKDMGMRPGVSDLFIAMPCRGFGGAWLELKSKNGVVSIHQKEFLKDMSEQNYFTAVCWSVDEAINTIKWYCSF